MPISVNLLLACLTVMRLMCFAIGALFLALAIKGQFDAGIAMSWGQATIAGLGFIGAGAACGVARKALMRRSGLS